MSTRIKQGNPEQTCCSIVSFVVPAYNVDGIISHCINSLFERVEEYAGECEVIVVDDGSEDYTYEMAWSTINLNRKQYPRFRGRVIRHSAKLGEAEAIKTGMNKALGQIIVVDPNTV